MKTYTKVTLIFSSIFIVLGLIAIVVALTLGVKFSDINYRTTDFKETYTNITSLDIQVDAGEVEIKEGEEFKIDATRIIKSRFSSEVKNGVWIIKEKSYRYLMDFVWQIGRTVHLSNYSPKITIYLPKDVKLDKTTIDIGAGKGTIEKLNTKSLVINVGAGELEINDLLSEESNIDCGVGSVSINGIMTGHNKVDCGVGNVTLNLKGKETDYNYKYSVGLGEFTINDSAYSHGVSDGKKDNNALNDFDIDCGIGSIDITIKE